MAIQSTPYLLNFRNAKNCAKFVSLILSYLPFLQLTLLNWEQQQFSPTYVLLLLARD